MSDICYRGTTVDLRGTSTVNWFIAGILVAELIVAAALYVNVEFSGNTSGIMVKMPKVEMLAHETPENTG